MVVASVGVHLLMWPLGNQVLQLGWDSPPLPANGGWMEVSLIDPELDEDEAEARRREMIKPPGKLVRQSRVVDERPPEDSDRVSEFDSRVDNETVAPSRKRAREYDPSRMGKKAGISQPASSESAAREIPDHALPLGRLNPAEANEMGERADPTDLADDSYGRQSSRVGGTAPKPRVGLRTGVHGNRRAMRETFGGSASSDGLQDVEEGTESLLNSNRFRFASFYNRVRSQSEQHWHPNEVMHRIDPDGSRFSGRTRRTLLRVRLTPEGKVYKIDIVKGSGVRELDKEAVSAVQLGAPFVNPPPQMVDPKTDLIEIMYMFELYEGRASIHRYVR